MSDKKDLKNLVVRTKIKSIAKGFSVSKEFREKLDEVVAETIERACIRAKSNNRNTLMARDL